jgi:hypothetical protein
LLHRLPSCGEGSIRLHGTIFPCFPLHLPLIRTAVPLLFARFQKARDESTRSTSGNHTIPYFKIGMCVNGSPAEACADSECMSTVKPLPILCFSGECRAPILPIPIPSELRCLSSHLVVSPTNKLHPCPSTRTPTQRTLGFQATGGTTVGPTPSCVSPSLAAPHP